MVRRCDRPTPPPATLVLGAVPVVGMPPRSSRCADVDLATRRGARRVRQGTARPLADPPVIAPSLRSSARCGWAPATPRSGVIGVAPFFAIVAGIAVLGPLDEPHRTDAGAWQGARPAARRSSPARRPARLVHGGDRRRPCHLRRERVLRVRVVHERSPARPRSACCRRASTSRCPDQWPRGQDRGRSLVASRAPLRSRSCVRQPSSIRRPDGGDRHRMDRALRGSRGRRRPARCIVWRCPHPPRVGHAPRELGAAWLCGRCRRQALAGPMTVESPFDATDPTHRLLAPGATAPPGSLPDLIIDPSVIEGDVRDLRPLFVLADRRYQRDDRAGSDGPRGRHADRGPGDRRRGCRGVDGDHGRARARRDARCRHDDGGGRRERGAGRRGQPARPPPTRSRCSGSPAWTPSSCAGPPAGGRRTAGRRRF